MNISQLFFQNLKNTPNKVALEFEHTEYSYSKLSQLALGVSQAICNTSSEESFCAIFAHKSISAYAAALGILHSGKAYVPLNPAFPFERNQFIAKKTDFKKMIVGKECLPLATEFLSQTSQSYEVIFVEQDESLSLLEKEFSNKHQFTTIQKNLAYTEANPTFNLAYTLFTSGSTGNPKGVVVTHANVLAYIKNINSLHSFSKDDRFTQTFDLTFDPSVHDLFVAWSNNATLVVYDSSHLMQPIQYTNDKKITIWFSVPSVAFYLASSRQTEDNALPHLKKSFFCAERFTFNSFLAWKKMAPQSEIINIYGPTEATITVSQYVAPSNFEEQDCCNGGLPIGKMFPTMQGKVFNDQMQEVSQGETGILYLNGPQVTPGYLNEPQMTQKAFVILAGSIWYNTGDQAFFDTNQDLQYIGRVDHQVKVQGYRIELGEIENKIMQVTEASNVIVDVHIFKNGVEELFCALPSSIEQNKKSITTPLKKILPKYMIPKKFFWIDSFPLNASGKVDRKEIKKIVCS